MNDELHMALADYFGAIDAAVASARRRADTGYPHVANSILWEMHADDLIRAATRAAKVALEWRGRESSS